MQTNTHVKKTENCFSKSRYRVVEVTAPKHNLPFLQWSVTSNHYFPLRKAVDSRRSICRNG